MARTIPAHITAWLKSFLFQDAVSNVPKPRAPRPERLAKAFYETMWFGTNPSGGTPFEDAEHAALVCGALTSLLKDYRENRAQTPEEVAIATALDHIDRTYLES